MASLEKLFVRKKSSTSLWRQLPLKFKPITRYRKLNGSYLSLTQIHFKGILLIRERQMFQRIGINKRITLSIKLRDHSTFLLLHVYERI